MKNKQETTYLTQRWIIFYCVLIICVGLLFWFTSQYNNILITSDTLQNSLPNPAKLIQASQFYHFLLALLVIIVISRLLNLVLKFTYQPLVISEMVAGILIGPSFLGTISPELYTYLIPTSIVPSINMIAQIGIIIYMFLIGMEFDLSMVKSSNKTVVAVAKASIIFPFILGILLATWLYNHNLMLPTTGKITFNSFALFIGISMSVTAFPVLARILSDQGMQKSNIGVLALTCASVNDVIAWCLLALVVGLVNSVITGALITIVATMFYVLFMVFLIKPLAELLSVYLIQNNYKDEHHIALLLIALITSALTAEFIGIHAIFGAFLLGIIMPQNNPIINNMTHKLKDVICILFLPAFFTYIGIKTQINLINSLESVLLCIAIISLAIAGKFGGTYVTARFFGMNNKTAASLGVLMNTRGLVELIVLNIGLELGVISQELFTILVIMAIFTTCMTGPALHFIKDKTK